jgi:hypothetical protein
MRAKTWPIGIIIGLILTSSVSYGAEGKKNVVALSIESAIGESGKSLNGSFGYALSLKGNKGVGIVRSTLGGSFLYTPGEIRFTSGTRAAKVYSAEFTAGFLIVPMEENQISPYLELNGSFGTANLQVASPPSGIDSQSLSLTYGYQAGFGVQLPVSGKSALRLSASYVKRAASKLASQNSFDLSSMTYSIALNF